MDEDRKASQLTLEVEGPFMGASVFELPDGIPAAIVDSETKRGLDAQALVNLIIEVDWQALLSGVGINLFSQWLYDSFGRDRGNVTISAKGRNVTVVVLTDPSAVERALRELVDETNRDGPAEQD